MKEAPISIYKPIKGLPNNANSSLYICTLHNICGDEPQNGFRTKGAATLSPCVLGVDT